MTTAVDLLPASSGPFTRALAFAATDELPVPIREIVDPAQTPAEFLPFLAAHEGVRLWWDDWSEDRQREIIADWTRLAALIGTRAAADEFLRYVDGALLDKVSFPTRFVFGRAVIGRTPVGHPRFVARHLVKVPTSRERRAMVFGRTRIAGRVLGTPSRERLDRCLAALGVSKAPETELRVDFAHKRHVRLSDGVPLDGSLRLGSYVDRTRL